MSRKLDTPITAKFNKHVAERVEVISRKFGIERSEVVRRSVDIGLAKIEHAGKLPPVVQEEGTYK